MPQANRWNRLIYAMWSPFYDLLVNAPALQEARRKAFDLLNAQPGDRLCLVGVGTGADFRNLPEGVTAVGVDLSAPMLAKARAKLPVPGCDITLQEANAEALPFADGSFDAAVLTLIVSVATDGRACLREAARVVRPGGRILVFDKFLATGASPSLPRRLFNLLTRFFGTDINRSFENLSGELPLRILIDQPALFHGAYRSILLEKSEPPADA